jgi:hypothetical protein
MFQLNSTEAWYALSKEEQNEVLDKVEAIDKEFNVENILICESGWSNEEWRYFGVAKHQSIESVQEHNRRLDEIQWFRYAKTKTLLGTPWSRS